MTLPIVTYQVRRTYVLRMAIVQGGFAGGLAKADDEAKTRRPQAKKMHCKQEFTMPRECEKQARNSKITRRDSAVGCTLYICNLF